MRISFLLFAICTAQPPVRSSRCEGRLRASVFREGWRRVRRSCCSAAQHAAIRRRLQRRRYRPQQEIRVPPGWIAVMPAGSVGLGVAAVHAQRQQRPTALIASRTRGARVPSALEKSKCQLPYSSPVLLCLSWSEAEQVMAERHPGADDFRNAIHHQGTARAERHKPTQNSRLLTGCAARGGSINGKTLAHSRNATKTMARAAR